MGFRTGTIATVWKITPKSDKRTLVQLLISRKNKDTGEYEQTFSGFVSFCGTATAAAAAKLHQKDRIKLGDVDVTTTYDAETKTGYTNFSCFGFEMVDGGSGAQKKSESSQKTIDNVDSGEVISDGDLPF